MFAAVFRVDLLEQFLNPLRAVPGLLALVGGPGSLHELAYIDALSISLALLGLALTFALHVLEVGVCLDGIEQDALLGLQGVFFGELAATGGVVLGSGRSAGLLGLHFKHLLSYIP